MSEDFQGTIRRILKHIDYPNLDRHEALLDELRFFDLKSSPLYRFSLSNALFGQHADPASAIDRRLQLEALRHNKALQDAYREINDLMPVGAS
jgi:hypothetical protein